MTCGVDRRCGSVCKRREVVVDEGGSRSVWLRGRTALMQMLGESGESMLSTPPSPMGTCIGDWLLQGSPRAVPPALLLLACTVALLLLWLLAMAAPRLRRLAATSSTLTALPQWLWSTAASGVSGARCRETVARRGAVVRAAVLVALEVREGAVGAAEGAASWSAWRLDEALEMPEGAVGAAEGAASGGARRLLDEAHSEQLLLHVERHDLGDAAEASPRVMRSAVVSSTSVIIRDGWRSSSSVAGAGEARQSSEAGGKGGSGSGSGSGARAIGSGGERRGSRDVSERRTIGECVV